MTAVLMYYLTRQICGGQVALGQGSPRPPALHFSPVSVIPPVLRTHLQYFCFQMDERAMPGNLKTQKYNGVCWTERHSTGAFQTGLTDRLQLALFHMSF